jgi:hypothetical protein
MLVSTQVASMDADVMVTVALLFGLTAAIFIARKARTVAREPVFAAPTFALAGPASVRPAHAHRAVEGGRS